MNLKCYVISCSADAALLNVRHIYVHWGEFGGHWLPESKKEAEHRLYGCQQKHKCEVCDAEIHQAQIVRKKKMKRNY
jgi:hypothetical protein